MTTLCFDDAVTRALHDEMARDERVLLLGTGVAMRRPGLLRRFGAARVRNTPPSEAVVMGSAVGAAAGGLRPVLDLLHAPRLAPAMDLLVNGAGKLRYLSGGQHGVPLVVLAHTGAAGGAGAAHSHNVEAWFAHAPGLKVAMPSNASDAHGLVIAAVRDDNPVLLLLDRALAAQAGEVDEGSDGGVPLGRARRLRSGRDLTLVGYARTVGTCLQAADALEAAGLSADVLDLRSLKPLDMATVLASVQRTGRLLVVHEAGPTCGIGAELLARVSMQAFDVLRAPPQRITSPDVPVPAAPQLERAFVPGVQAVLGCARRLCEPALA